jgi:hypothetical protein
MGEEKGYISSQIPQNPSLKIDPSERPKQFTAFCVTERLRRFLRVRNLANGKRVLSVFENGALRRVSERGDHQDFIRKEENKGGIPFQRGGKLRKVKLSL